MTDLSSLHARVMAATGPDRELDRMLWDQFFSDMQAVGFDDAPYAGIGTCFTDSVDAALGLVERLLPGWLWSVDTMSVPPGKWSKVKRQPQAQLAEPIVTQFGDGVGIRAQVQSATPALAILSALLSALASQAQEGK